MTLDDLGIEPEDPTYRWEYKSGDIWMMTLLYLTEKTAANIFGTTEHRKAEE